MNIIETEFEGLYLFEPTVFKDHRGSFFESFNAQKSASIIGDIQFVQDNHSFSNKNVLRGMHFQTPPHDQVKIVRVIQGEVLDVVVDIRKSSATYGKYFKVILSAANKKQLYIPVGFAHGFLVLSATAEFVYKCSNFYHPHAESGLAFDDPDIGIDWGVPADQLILSDKDLALRANRLQDFNYYE